jgi:putative oxidoreductase
MTTMRTRPLYDVVALLARTGVGAVFIAHGWQKVQVGITTTSDQFTALDVPFPTVVAVYATFVELLGGAALILGLGLPVAGVLLFIDMAGALAFVNGQNGIFLVDEQGVARDGFELVLVLGLAALLFAAGGGGRLTLDHRLFPRRHETDTDSTPDWVASLGADRDDDDAAKSTSAAPPADAAPVEPPRSPAKVKKPAMPATTGGPTVPEVAASPRLAADIVKDTSGDTLVAGRKRRRPGGKGGKNSRGDTQPAARPGKRPKDPADE